jgi:hypothetical protein
LRTLWKCVWGRACITYWVLRCRENDTISFFIWHFLDFGNQFWSSH